MIPLPGIPHSFPDNGGQELHPPIKNQKDHFLPYIVSVRCSGHSDTGVIYTQAQSLGLTLLCLISAVPPEQA